jgi:hypothetical protein
MNSHDHNPLKQIEDRKKSHHDTSKQRITTETNGTHPGKLDKLVFLYNQPEESQQLLHIPSTPRKAKTKYGISLPTFDHHMKSGRDK